MFLIKKKKQSKKTRRQKAKETKEEKRVSVENLTGYDYMAFEFAQCTFNLLDRFVNFPRLLFSLCAPREITERNLCFTTSTYEVHTSRTKIK